MSLPPSHSSLIDTDIFVVPPPPAYWANTCRYPPYQEFWAFTVQLQATNFHREQPGKDKPRGLVLTGKECTDAWKDHLISMNRQGDFEGAANFFTRYRPHIIFVWSAAGCQISTTVPSLEKTIAIFWRAAKNFLLHLLCTNKEGLLASWKDRDPGSTSTDLAIKTIEYIRLQRPAWPYLGNADPVRLLWYVLDETALNAAWNGTLSAPTGVQVCRETAGTVNAAAWYAVTTTAEQYAELHAAQSPLDELAEVAAGLAAKAAAAAEAESPADKAELDTSKYLRNSPESPLDHSDVHAAAGGGQRTAAAAAAAESPAATPSRPSGIILSNSATLHTIILIILARRATRRRRATLVVANGRPAVAGTARRETGPSSTGKARRATRLATRPPPVAGEPRSAQRIIAD